MFSRRLDFIVAPVHPRACGEHSKRGPSGGRPAGSSPRLRGTYCAGSRFWQAPRFIPAPAGNIGASGASPALAAVHPRACGEHRVAQGGRDDLNGSSPRVRGTYFIRLDQMLTLQSRFIPACAGNIRYQPALPYEAVTTVHPRVCGEH